jgi:hypothetical protein
MLSQPGTSAYIRLCLVPAQVPVKLSQGKSTNLTASVQGVLVLKDAGANVPAAIILTPYGRFAVFANGPAVRQRAAAPCYVLACGGLHRQPQCTQRGDRCTHACSQISCHHQQY